MNERLDKDILYHRGFNQGFKFCLGFKTAACIQLDRVGRFMSERNLAVISKKGRDFLASGWNKQRRSREDCGSDEEDGDVVG